MVESAELPNGTIYTDTHRYRVVGSTLVLTKDGNTTAALFTIGNTLRLDVGHYILILIEWTDKRSSQTSFDVII